MQQHPAMHQKYRRRRPEAISDRNSKLLARFQKCLEEEVKGDAQDQAQEARISQTVFWSETRNILAVNSLSSGLDILDDVAKALIDDTGLAAQALSGPHTQEEARTGQAGQGQRIEEAEGFGQCESNPVALGTPLITFPFTTGLPKEFVRVWKALPPRGSCHLKAWQRAYPWVNQHLFYDPVEDPDVYLGYWRFWHNCWAGFLEWALHVTLRTDSDKVQRGKRKGYVTGKTTKEAKGYSYSPIQDLFKLYQKNKVAYERKIQDAIKPFHIDKGGFATITEMLEQTEAFNPALVVFENRLSDKALVRVAMDLTARHFVPEHWVPSDEVRKALRNDDRIKSLQINFTVQMLDGEYELPTGTPFNSKEFTDNKYRSDPDEEAEAELAEEEAKANAAKQDTSIEAPSLQISARRSGGSEPQSTSPSTQ
ncbi:hypothetical protein PR001_g22766 [Phytophthora rubi]|uniref:Uncharacterized protein n=1 Tax=Phytophthora rubi TaxID=129364 RepID=A0A6A3J011_9STRA|nr:hypothetical protein PR001_g22766 [Phytophthora rubi]